MRGGGGGAPWPRPLAPLEVGAFGYRSQEISFFLLFSARLRLVFGAVMFVKFILMLPNPREVKARGDRSKVTDFFVSLGGHDKTAVGSDGGSAATLVEAQDLRADDFSGQGLSDFHEQRGMTVLLGRGFLLKSSMTRLRERGSVTPFGLVCERLLDRGSASRSCGLSFSQSVW